MQILPTQTASETQSSVQEQLKASMQTQQSLFAESFAASLNTAQNDFLSCETAQATETAEQNEQEQINETEADSASPDDNGSETYVLESTVSFLHVFPSSAPKKATRTESAAKNAAQSTMQQKTTDSSQDEENEDSTQLKIQETGFERTPDIPKALQHKSQQNDQNQTQNSETSQLKREFLNEKSPDIPKALQHKSQQNDLNQAQNSDVSQLKRDILNEKSPDIPKVLQHQHQNDQNQAQNSETSQHKREFLNEKSPDIPKALQDEFRQAEYIREQAQEAFETHRQLKNRHDDAAFAQKWHKEPEKAYQLPHQHEEAPLRAHLDPHGALQSPHAPHQHTPGREGSSHDRGFSRQPGQGDVQNGWKKLTGKLHLDTAAGGHLNANRGFDFSSVALQHTGPLSAFDPLRSLPGQSVPLAEHVSAQVESGLFSSLKNGASRLELQLHPQELGTIAITLMSRNGEVSAHIKADNAETAAMLTRQAEIIKQNLEDQGIRIDKIEVELQEPETQADADQLLQDMEHHNSFQEEGARRDHLRRLKNLASVPHHANTHEKSVTEREASANGSRMLDRVA